MMIPEISSQDIRLAKPATLERLTGISSACFCHWSANREMTGRSIRRIATSLKTTPAIVVEGFELRRLDYQAAQISYQKFDELLLAVA
jgi:hypothetical protein